MIKKFYMNTQVAWELGGENWVKLNILKESNHTIGLEFYANSQNHGINDYTYYKIGKYISNSTHVINRLLDLRPSELCGVKNR